MNSARTERGLGTCYAGEQCAYIANTMHGIKKNFCVAARPISRAFRDSMGAGNPVRTGGASREFGV